MKLPCLLRWKEVVQHSFSYESIHLICSESHKKKNLVIFYFEKLSSTEEGVATAVNEIETEKKMLNENILNWRVLKDTLMLHYSLTCVPFHPFFFAVTYPFSVGITRPHPWWQSLNQRNLSFRTDWKIVVALTNKPSTQEHSQKGCPP